MPGTQVLSVSDGRAGTDGITRNDTVTLVQAAMDGLPDLRDVEIEIGDDGVLDVRLVCTIDGTGSRYAGPAKSVINDAAREQPDGPARIAIGDPTVATCAGLGGRRSGFRVVGDRARARPTSLPSRSAGTTTHRRSATGW